LIPYWGVNDNAQLGYDWRMKYPNRLKQMRQKAHLSQEQLAQKINSGRSTIQKYESGERGLSDDVKKKLSAALMCEPWELMEDSLAPEGRQAELLQLYKTLLPDEKRLLLETARAFVNSRHQDS